MAARRKRKAKPLPETSVLVTEITVQNEYDTVAVKTDSDGDLWIKSVSSDVEVYIPQPLIEGVRDAINRISGMD